MKKYVKTLLTLWYIAICVAVFGEQKAPGIGKWSWYFETIAGGICSSEQWCNIYAGAILKTTVIPWSYNVGGSETGDISRDRFSHKCSVKVGRLFPDSLFYKEKRYIHIYFTNKWPCKEQALLLKCKGTVLTIISSVQQCNCQCTNPWRWL